MNRTDHLHHSTPIARTLPRRIRALRSTPVSFVRAYAAASAGCRAAVLDRLVRSAGSLALAVIGGGAFVKFVWDSRPISIEDAASVTASQLYELACYVQQANPGLLEQILGSLPALA